jgi:hypothetical protein
MEPKSNRHQFDADESLRSLSGFVGLDVSEQSNREILLASTFLLDLPLDLLDLGVRQERMLRREALANLR